MASSRSLYQRIAKYSDLNARSKRLEERIRLRGTLPFSLHVPILQDPPEFKPAERVAEREAFRERIRRRIAEDKDLLELLRGC